MNIMEKIILVVDDNELDRTMLCSLLDSEYKTVSVSSGQEAMIYIEKNSYKIAAIILDIIMPDMDGYQVLQKIHEDIEFSQIPVIVTTNLEDDKTRERSLVFGANGFITKPYNKVLLLHAVRNVVNLSNVVRINEQQKAEKQRKMLLENLPIGAALYEYNGADISVVHINKMYWRIVNMDPVDINKIVVLDAIYPADRELILQEINSAIRQKRNISCDFRLLTSNRIFKPFHIEASITQKDNGIYMLYAYYKPISEKTMSVQEVFPIALSVMMSSIEDYAYIKDRDSHYICCSNSYIHLVNINNPKDIIGKSDFDLFDTKKAEILYNNDKAILTTGKPIINYNEVFHLKNGEVIYVNSFIYPIIDSEGDILGFYGLYHDITKEHELTLELNTLLYSIPSGVLKYSAEGKGEFEYINRNFIHNLGYTEESFKKKFHNCFSDMVYIEDRARTFNEVLVQEQNGNIGKFDYRVEAADGSLRWIHDEGVKIQDHLGKDWYYVSLFDVTDQKNTLEELRISEEVNRLAIEHSGNTVIKYNIKKRILVLPESLDKMYNLPQVIENLPEGQIELGNISPETIDNYRSIFTKIHSGSAFGTVTFQQNSTNGWRWIEAQYTTVFSDKKEPISAVITLSDITERLEKEVVYTKWQQSLTNRDKNSYTLIRCNPSKNKVFNNYEGNLLTLQNDQVNMPYSEFIIDYAQNNVHIKDQTKYLAFLNKDSLLADFYRGIKSKTLEYRANKDSKVSKWIKLSIELVEYPNSKDVELYLTYEDIDKAKKKEIKTKKLAVSDPLTGVLNRVAFVENLDHIITHNNQIHGLLMIDIDNFKQVNDTYGHEAGDTVLCEFTKQVKSILRIDDLFGRIGGDEFIILLTNIPNSQLVVNKAQKIGKLRIKPTPVAKAITMSIGIAIIPQDGLCFEDLYRKVDNAMYNCKSNGKNGYMFVKD